MNCPKCNTAFEKRQIGDMRVAECPQHGLWFEKDELRQAKDEIDSDLKWIDFDLWKNQDLFHISAQALKCPECQKPMATVRYGTTDVVVDTCVSCRGIWLDKGEFKQIVQALENELADTPASEYARVSLQEAREIVTGDEGLLSEWRDLRTVTRLLQYRLLVENPKLQEALSAFQASTPFK